MSFRRPALASFQSFRKASEAYGMWGFASLLLSLLPAVAVGTQWHWALGTLVVLVAFPLGAWGAAGLARFRAVTHGVLLPVQSTRPLLSPFMAYGVEWAELPIGKLQQRCPEHHTPLLFWPEDIVYERTAPRRHPRPVEARDRPFENLYGRHNGTLWCAEDGQEFRFAEDLSIAEAAERIWLRERGKQNREARV